MLGMLRFCSYYSIRKNKKRSLLPSPKYSKPKKKSNQTGDALFFVSVTSPNTASTLWSCDILATGSLSACGSISLPVSYYLSGGLAASGTTLLAMVSQKLFLSCIINGKQLSGCVTRAGIDAQFPVLSEALTIY